MPPTVKSPKTSLSHSDSASGLKRRSNGVADHARDELRAELGAQKRFEWLVADLSTIFLNAPPEQIDGDIDSSLERLAAVLGNERCIVAEFQSDNHSTVVTHSYADPNSTPFPLGALNDDRLPWHLRQVRCGKVVLVRDPNELLVEAEKERQYCLAEGIKSIVAIPLTVGGVTIGAITFDFLRAECRWNDSFVHQLQLIGSVFANALLHKRDQQALRAALTEGEQLRSQLAEEDDYLRERINLKHQSRGMIGKSAVLQNVIAEAECVAKTDSPVLLLGETGTGKELLAKTIHEMSARRRRQMVVVNCASLPSTLVESELFGREAGAYTGAATAQIGRFAAADGSTLFLDEIGDLPVELQSKLLRVLEDGRFEQLGSPRTVKVDVRLIAATNRNLEQAVEDGRFRADLYHRLNVFPIRIPPLRERNEDIPLLIWSFVERFSRRMGKLIKRIPAKTIRQLQQYAWPGNIRELRNIIERAMILATDDVLRVEALGSDQVNRTQPTLQESEREQILAVLETTGWRIRGGNGAAEILGLKATTLEARMAKLGIKRPKQNSNIS
jgi:transcriptional regulator with GAF, ATPase, and Fis domain